MHRVLRGMLVWGLVGAAAGAYVMSRADHRTRRGLRNRGRRLGRGFRRAASEALRSPGLGLSQAMRAGRTAVGATMKALARR